MLVDPSIETLKTKTDSSYETAILVALRARQLNEGAQPMVGDKAANALSLACREVIQDKVVSVPGKVKPEVPITREERLRRIEEEKKRQQALEEKLASQSLDNLVEVVKKAEASTDDLFAEITVEEAAEAEIAAADSVDDDN